MDNGSNASNAGRRIWRVCPLCGGDESDLLHAKDPLRIVRCARCGMAFANPVGESFLNGSFYADLVVPFYLSPAKLEGDYAEVRFKRELRSFRRRCSAGRVLDVGCSTGAFLHQLQQRFPGSYQVTGLDVAGPALDHAERYGVPVSRVPFLEHGSGEPAFDAITFWAVLEHVEQPGQFVARAASLLRPGGHCFVLVPNLRSLAVRLLGKRYRYLMPEHLNYFTADTLRRVLAQESRFELLSLRSTHFNPIVIWQDWRGSDSAPTPADRADLLRRTTHWKQSRLLAPLRLLHRAAEIALAQFGLADNLLAVLRRKAIPPES